MDIGYDHYLTQITWSLLTWEEYLQWIAPIYGEFGGYCRSFNSMDRASMARSL